jgi:hypothetical protein
MSAEDRMRLTESELFDAEGHLSDVALVALADGQDALVPPPSRAHLDACPACLSRLGEHALASTRVGAALLASGAADTHEAFATDAANSSPGELSAFAVRARHVPIPALVVAAVLGLVGLVPRLLAGATDPMEAVRTLRALVPAASRLASWAIDALFGGGSVPLLAALVVASFVLILAGVAFARIVPPSLATASRHNA